MNLIGAWVPVSPAAASEDNAIPHVLASYYALKAGGRRELEDVRSALGKKVGSRFNGKPRP